MTGEKDFGTIANEVLDGGNGGSNPGVVGDVLIVVEGHIEVSPHEDLLALEISRGQVADALLHHGGGAPNGLAGGAAERSELSGDVVGQEGLGGGEAQAAERGPGEEAGGGGIEGSPGGGGGRSLGDSAEGR